MSEFDIRLFGRFRVLRDGVELDPPIGLSAAVFKALAVNQGVINREKLIGQLWPDDSLDVGRTRLKHVLYRVRQDTGARIQSRRATTVVLQDPFRCDITEFIQEGLRTLSGGLDSEDSERALLRLQAMWMGPPLEDNPYDLWAEDVIRQAHAVKERLWLLLDAR